MNAFFTASCLACLAPTILSAADSPQSVVVAIRYYLTEGTSHGHLYLFGPDANAVRQLTRDDSGQDHDPVFAPDGRSIVYRRRMASGEQWRSIRTSGEGDQALEQAPAWHQKSAAAPACFDYPEDVPIPDQPGRERSYAASKPGDIVFKMDGGEFELVLKDGAHQADPKEPSWYPKTPFLRAKGREEDHFKPLGCLAIPVRRGHAADGEQLARAHPFGCHIKEFVAQVDALDQADDDAVAADLQRAPLHAFQAGGRLRDARRFDDRRRRGVQSGTGQLAFAKRQRGGALVHRPGNGLVHQVHDELMGGASLLSSTLQASALFLRESSERVMFSESSHGNDSDSNRRCAI